MYNHFVCQLSDARLMDVNKKYKKHLKSINKQHNFIILRSIHGGNYETEMKRSMLLEKLQHIHESLCFESRIRPSNSYRRMRPIDFTNKKIKSCQDCGGVFSFKDGSAELTCVNCGRIEVIDGTGFKAQQKRKNKTRKYTFKNALNKSINEYKDIITPLLQEQINTTNLVFEQIERQLPKTISYHFAIYKILDKIISKDQQRVWLDLAYFASPSTQSWKYELEWKESIKRLQSTIQG